MTGISVACVAVVTAALIIILSAMNGLTDLVKTLYNSFHPEIRITAVKGKHLFLTPLMLSQSKNLPMLFGITKL